MKVLEQKLEVREKTAGRWRKNWKSREKKVRGVKKKFDVEGDKSWR